MISIFRFGWLFPRTLLAVVFGAAAFLPVSGALAACDPAPAGLIGWWPGDGNAQDIQSTNNGILKGNAAANGAGLVGQSLTFDGTNSFVQIPDNPVFHLTNLTIETWVRFDSLDSAGANAPAGDQYLVFKQNSMPGNFEGFDLSKRRIAGGDVFRFLVAASNGQTLEIDSTTLLTTGIWYHVAAVRGTNFTQIYVNGHREAQGTVSFAPDYGTLPLYFGTTGQTNWDRKLKGSLDEVSIYNRVLSSNEIAAVYAAGPSGKCKPSSLVITAQPESQNVAVGSSPHFTVAASGPAPLGYQWWRAGLPLPGATGTSLSLSNVDESDGGTYSVVVTNSSATVTSAIAVLNVAVPPLIASAPEPLTVAMGGVATFNSAAAGGAPLSRQWRLNGVNLSDDARISGSGTESLKISEVRLADAGSYTMVASNAVGEDVSAPAVLTVLSVPVITDPPASQCVAVGRNTTLTVAASGTPPLGYQWYFNGARIAGASSATLTLDNVQMANAGGYCVVVTNPTAAVTSAPAILTVMQRPAIVTQPQSSTRVLGTVASFGGAVSGGTPLAFQWKRNGVNLPNGGRVSGATSATLMISSLQNSDAGTYSFVATNPVGTVASAPAVLTVIAPPSITTPPASQTAFTGSNVIFNVSYSGTAPLTFQWRKNGTNLADGGQILGSASSSLLISAAQPANAGSYSVSIANSAGAVTSAPASLTVVAAPNCSAPPSGLIGWWTGDGTANDLMGPDNGSLQGGANVTATGKVGQGFGFDGTNSYVSFPDTPILRPSVFTIEAWVKFNSLDSGGNGAPLGDQYIVFKQNTRGGDFEGFDLSKTRKSGSDVFRFLITSATAQRVEIDSTTPLAAGVWYHVAALRGTNFMQLYVNGNLEAQGSITFPQDYGAFPLYFGTSGESFWDRKFNGVLDEVSLYGRPLSGAEIAAIYAAGANGKCKSSLPPAIYSQPASQTLVSGGTVLFSVGAVGPAPLGYQWQKDGFKLNNGGRISGATSSSLIVSNLGPSDIGNYQVIVSNAYGSATSLVAALSTGIPPSNDAFASAQGISGSSGSVNGNNANATKQSGEPNHAGNTGGASVWYTWTAPSASPVTFDTAMSAFDTVLAVYTGTSVGALTVVASNDNATTNTTRSRVTFTPVSGTVYRIAVDGAGGVTGNLVLRWVQANVALPDLTIVASAVNPQISTETFDPSSCAVVEGLIQAGTRRIIRFDTETENQGNADLYFGDPSANPLFVWAPCHAHYHFNNYMAYRLLDGNGKVAALGLKVGFCVLDVFRWKSGAAANAKYNCGTQGIQVGWGDLYDHSLDGQWIDITGLPDGNYTMEIEPNPQGIILESNYGNNVVHVPVTIGNPNGAPANNNFGSAQTLLGGFSSVSGTTANATKQSGEPNHAGNAGGHSVWYQWTAVDTKAVTLDTFGSSFNTLLAVYTGSSLASLVPIASNDDASAGVMQSKLTFSANAGTVYQIAVDGNNGASGNFILTLNQTIDNDNFANPEFIGGANGSVHGSNAGGSKEAGEPNHANNSGGASIWYAWTAPINGVATFSTVGSTFNTLLAAYTGNSVNFLTPVAANDDIDPVNNIFQSRVTFNAAGLARYYIAIDGYNGATGDTTLSWNLQAGGSFASLAQPATPERAKVENIFLPNGEFELLLTGQADQRYLIERSCDLRTWTPLVTTLADDSGRASFVDKSTMHLERQGSSSDPICGAAPISGGAFSPGVMRFYRATPMGIVLP